VNCSAVPAATEGFAGVTAIDTKDAASPVPVREIVCGLSPALSTKINVPDRVPVAAGENVTDTLQLAPTASVEGLKGQVEVKPKSLRLLVMLVIFNLVD
jgi:hypothetical protein